MKLQVMTMNEHLLSRTMNPNQAMADSLGEQLSALMDGELARDQVRFLLRGVETRSDLARRWSNYHLVSATLKREYVAFELSADFADGVIGRLEDTVAVTAVAAPSRRIGFGALRWVGGGAVAAAVAVVALTVSKPVQQQTGMSPTVAVAGQQATQQRFASQPYLPLALVPGSAAPVFDRGEIQPAGIGSALPGYLQPHGNELSAGQMEGFHVPYLSLMPGQALQNFAPAEAPARR
jgi:sigma-E factor negative regulatory protein RseA